jgi:hypothetical protein
MSVTAQEIIVEALGIIGAIAIDETPETSELNAALKSLNMMIDSWGAQSLMLRDTTTVTHALTAGVNSYTIAASAAVITAAKPIMVVDAFTRDGSDIDTPLSIIQRQEYNSFSQKSDSDSTPQYLYYDSGSLSTALGTIYLYPPPDDGNTLYMDYTAYLSNLATLATTVTLEPAYYEALSYNLAVRLFRRYHDAKVAIPPDVVALAVSSKRIVEAMNSKRVVARLDLPPTHGRYNVLTDQ